MNISSEAMNSASAVQRLLDAFNRDLLSGALRPGDRISTEVELSEQFGVSRNTVREAIKILVAMGVLEIRRPVGTFVCEGFSEAMISPMLYGVILGRGDSYDELMDLREIMEIGRASHHHGMGRTGIGQRDRRFLRHKAGGGLGAISTFCQPRRRCDRRARHRYSAASRRAMRRD